MQNLSKPTDKFFVGGAEAFSAGGIDKIFSPNSVIFMMPGCVNGFANGVFHSPSVRTTAESGDSWV